MWERIELVCQQRSIQIANLHEIELRQVQLQNEDGARKVIMERNANDISKLGEHNTFYQYQLCTPRSLTVN